MSKTCVNFCRICLTTDEHDNITESSCYTACFIQLLKTKLEDNLWLCMWCRATLRRTMLLIKLASQSEKILHSQSVVLADLKLKNSLHILSYQNITHIDISPTTIIEQKKQMILNVDMNKENCEINEIYIQNELYENLNEIYTDDHLTNEYCNEAVKGNELKLNEIISKETGYAVECLIIENETPIKINENIKVENEIEKNKREKNKLKLDELKFKVRYLNLEEQMNEIEMKKIKYKDMKFQCQLCGVGFLTCDYYEEHKRRHTEAAGTHKCSVCSLRFKSPLVHSQHMLAHRRQFCCLVCGTRVTKWSNCVVHRHKCGGVVRYVECQVCSKVFSDEHSLKVHSRAHSSHKTYSCEHCARSFITKQRLRIHIRSHTGVKPFACERCPRRFSTHSNLKAHSVVHTDACPHYCVECNTHYKTAKSLKRHLSESVRHIRERSYMFPCTRCSKEFSSAKALQTHVERHFVTSHIKCTDCDKTFSNKSNLNKHLKSIHRAKT